MRLSGSLRSPETEVWHMGRNTLGRAIKTGICYVGGLFYMFFRLILSLPRFHRSLPLIAEQLSLMGVNSLPLVVLTSLFLGMVTSVQAAYQSGGYVPDVYIGVGVGKAIMIELSPIIIGLVVAGRVGSSIAAELGTMRVTEQIDALESMALDPVRFLVLPRFISGIITLPLLVVFSEAVAIGAGLLIALSGLGISPHTFITGLRLNFIPRDIFGGLLKALIFGAVIATMGCYHGFNAEGGAEGVGTATTRAVVSSCFLILVFDYLIANWVFG